MSSFDEMNIATTLIMTERQIEMVEFALAQYIQQNGDRFSGNIVPDMKALKAGIKKARAGETSDLTVDHSLTPKEVA